jgi:hypothetical protein
MVTKEFKSRAIRMHQELEASVWNWLEDKLVYHLEAFPCILVKNIWWVHNSCIFKAYFISLKIYGVQIINVIKQFMVKKKKKKDRVSVMLNLN